MNGNFKMCKKNENDLYLIEVPTENTDHWKGQSEAYRKLSDLGASELCWFSGTNMNAHSYFARCSDDCLCLIKLAGYIVKKNMSETSIKSATEKILLALSHISFSGHESNEIDIKKLFNEIVEGYEFK